MPVFAIVLLVGPWLIVFYGLFAYDKLSKRVSAIQVQQNRFHQNQQAILDHLGIQVQIDPLTKAISELVSEGKTYEALEKYRTEKGASYEEAKAFIDSTKSLM